MDQPRTYPDGVPSWIDVEQEYIAAAQAFYGGLFGWTFVEVDAPGARPAVIARLDGRDVGGFSRARAGSRGAASTGWTTSVAVGDLDAAVQRVEAAGGRTASEAQNDGVGGRSIDVVDSTGVGFRLRRAGRRPGTQAVNEPGAWNFSYLHTNDQGRAIAFYRAVFGWEFDELGYATLIRQPGYGDHLASTVDPDIRERQSGVATPLGFEDAIAWLAAVGSGEEPPHWHVAFTVADRDDAASTAERLGGTVVSTSDTDWTREAIVRDPQGAVFTASQFAPAGV